VPVRGRPGAGHRRRDGSSGHPTRKGSHAACLFKIGWSYGFDESGTGADAFVVPALVGLAVVNAGLILAARRCHARATASV